MKDELTQLVNDIFERGIDYMSDARRDSEGNPFFRQQSGMCAVSQILDDVCHTLLECREKEAADAVEGMEKAAELLGYIKSQYGRDFDSEKERLEALIGSLQN